MTTALDADYGENYLLPQFIDDWVAKDHPVRFIRMFVESLNLERIGISEATAETGRPAYASRLLLKAWIYGYFDRILSSRQLEKACRERMPMIWLMGRREPDHNTLWRFFKANKHCFPKVFADCVRLATQNGLVGYSFWAVDGTKIRSRASNKTALYRRDIEQELSRLESIGKDITEAIEKNGDSGEDEGRMPTEMRDSAELRKKLRKDLETLDRADTNLLNPNDPEARVMVTDAHQRLCFNAQAIVENENGLIVGAEVVTDENDRRQLVPMIEEGVKNVGKAPDTTVADKGYTTSNALGMAEERGFEVVLPERESPKRGEGREEYSKCNFKYDSERDVFICPEGEALTYSHTSKNQSKDVNLRVYACHCSAKCPNRKKCCGSKRRMIEMHEHYDAVLRNREKLQLEENRVKLKKRSQTVELVFAWIKRIWGFDRMTMFGLENSRGQWSLMCLVHNLSKMYRMWKESRVVLS